MMIKSSLTVLICGLFFLKGEMQVVKWEWMQHHFEKKTDKVKVINFWATWCKPCIEELPGFETLHRQEKEADVLLVSLDRASLSNKTQEFLERKNITAPAVLLDEVDFNRWVDRVDSSWSGALPATLIINKKGERFFYEKTFTANELDSLFHDLNP